MISVIISSADKTYLADIKKNINTTIGVTYEIIAVENSDGKKSICEIYNEGTLLAQYEILCFTHEDVRFSTPNWGAKVVHLFNREKKIGLVGIAGSSYKSAAPSAWWHPHNLYNTEFIQIIQGSKKQGFTKRHQYNNPSKTPYPRVASVDGVWMCTRKVIAQQHSFDDKLLRGFHGYDLDFSLNVGQTYDIAITYDVILEHFSEGNYDHNWLDATLKVHKKWQKILPVNIAHLSADQQYRSERSGYEAIITKMFSLDYSKTRIAGMLFSSLNVFRETDRRLLRKTLKYLFKLKKKKVSAPY